MKHDDDTIDISQNFIHLGLGAKAEAQEAFDGMQWYARYGERNHADGVEGRLVSMHTFSEPWSSWEMHPLGHEVVICTKGKLTLVQEIDGEERRIVLESGQAAINSPGVWHTADVDDEATAVFITAGAGTEHRQR